MSGWMPDRRILQMILVPLVLIGIGISSSAFGDNSGYGYITEIKAWDNRNDVYIDKPNNCGHPDPNFANYYQLKTDSTEYRQKYALLLTAFSLGYRINVAYTCVGNIPEISAIRAKP